MRLAILLVALSLSPVVSAAEFRSTAPLTLSGKEPLHRLALPFEAYRDAKKDLADVRVINGRGDEVPMAWGAEEQATKEAARSVDLPVFPITRAGTVAQPLGAEITVRSSDGTLVAVKPQSATSATPPKPVAYVLDASQVTRPLRAVTLDWKSGPGAEVVNIRLEASDDLKSWSHLVAAPVVRIEAGDRALTQPRIEFPARRVKYVRLGWTGTDFTLTSVRAELEPEVRPAPRLQHIVPGSAAPKPGEYVYDLGARLPVESVRLVLPEPNSVVSATFYTREDDRSQWVHLTGAAFYRMQREGGEIQSPAAPIGRHAARYWMAKLAAGSSTGAAPSLEVQWRPAQVVFLAQGEGPFKVAFCNAAVPAAALPVATLMPGYEALGELKLPEARAGAVVSSATAPPPPDKPAVPVDWKRIALWSILFGGVAVLGFMAFRLSKQMKGTAE